MLYYFSLLIGACLAVVAIVHHLIKFRNYPSAPGLAIARYTRWWYAWKVYEGKFQAWNVEQHARHGPVLRVAPEMYVLREPSAVKQIYGISSQMPKSAWYDPWGDPRMPNLFAERDRHYHAQARRQVAGLYSMTTIKSYEPYVDNCVSVLQEHFDRFAAEGQMVDIQHWMQCYAFDVIGELTFGSRIGFMDSGGQDVDNIMHQIEQGLAYTSVYGVDSRLRPLLALIYGDPTVGLLAFSKKLQQMRREKGSQNGAQDFFSKCEALKEKDPEAYEKFHIFSTMTDNITAGSDTTSISLTSALFHIFGNREVCLKLRDEILKAEERGELQDPITFDQAQALPYFQRCFKEALRVFPASGLPLWRVVPEGGITMCGQFFPAGAVVGSNSWALHNDPQIFENPNVYNPDRWDPEVTGDEKLKLMEACYMPFGSGTRTCIGKNISTLEIFKVIPQLVRRYDFELASPDKPMESQNMFLVKQKDVFAKVYRRGTGSMG